MQMTSSTPSWGRAGNGSLNRPFGRIVVRRTRRDFTSPLLVGLAMIALTLTTGVQSYIRVQEEGETPNVAMVRLLVLPTVIILWVALSRRARRRAIWPLHFASIFPLLAVG